MGELVDQCSFYQKVAGVLSMILSTIAIIIGFYWGSRGNSPKEGWLGGFNNCTLHAVLMILGMCFCYTQAVVSFRVFHVLGHDTSKFLHFLWHTFTVALMAAALYYIIKWHNDGSYGHLSSMHSWLGLLLIMVYFQNWVLGIVNFGFKELIPSEWKKKYLPTHRFLGIVGLLLAAVVMETGIAQKNWIDGYNGCFYDFSSKEKQNPALGYTDIASGCRMSFGLGIIIILNTIVAFYALWQFPESGDHKKSDDTSPNNNMAAVSTEVGQKAKFELVPAVDNVNP